MSYLGPSDMEIEKATDARETFVITGNNAPLAERLFAKIQPGDRLLSAHEGGSWGRPKEVYDTDKEGTVLWNETDAPEETARTTDLYELVVTQGWKLMVVPR